MAKYKKRPDRRYATSTIVGYTDDDGYYLYLIIIYKK